MSVNPPELWQFAQLVDLLTHTLGGDWGKDPDHEDIEYEHAYCIRASEIPLWTSNKGSTAALRKIKKASIEKRALVVNDILVEISGGGPTQPVGRTVLIDETVLSINPQIQKICTNFFRQIRPSRFIFAKYLELFLESIYFSPQINELQSGSNNLRNLKFNDYLKLSVPVPPLTQQKKIVQKIEELFSEIDDGIESLERAKKQLDVYRKAILIQAFNGNLTKQWRALNSDKLPTEEYFVSAINRDREERYEKQVADWNKELLDWEKEGKIGSKPKKPKPLPRIEATQISTEGLPRGWIKTNLEYVCDFITKGTTPAKNELFAKQGDIPFIKVYNLTHKGYLDFSIDPTFVTKQTHEGFLKRSKVYPNDVLMNIVGPPLGKVSIVPDSYPEWNINQAIAIYRSNLIDSKYLSEFLLNENTVRAMMSQSKATAGQFNLTLEICRNFPIPVCSKLEQAEIVKSLSENLSNAQYLQETIDQQLEQLTLLKQTVLQKAFSGELVPQYPNDEPASVLLERIKAEKEEELAKAKANKAPKKPTKRKTKTTKEDEPAQQELI